jgi:WD40 repeat protein
MKYLKNLNILLTTLSLLLAACITSLSAQDGTAGYRIFKKHDAPVKAVAFNKEGSILATGGEDHMIYLWDLRTGDLTGTIQNAFTVKALQFTDDGNIMAACGNDVKLMDAKGNLIRAFSGYTTDIWSFSYNKTAQRIVAGSYAKTIKVWDYNTGKQALLLEGHERSCLPVCFSPKGNFIVSGSLDKSIRLWDATLGQEKSEMNIHSENIFSIDFHPSGKYFASASADKTIRLWNADSGKVVRTYSGHQGAVFDVRFSPDGHHLLSCDADNIIILWETATGKKVTSFSGHLAPVNAIRFNSSGSAFASCSDDKTVRYWNLDKRIFLAGSYFEKEIEKEAAQSPLFTPPQLMIILVSCTTNITWLTLKC